MIGRGDQTIGNADSRIEDSPYYALTGTRRAADSRAARASGSKK
ncbi:hypothetical protein ACU4GD_21400 [Cupriavidus basilensis]